MKFIVSIELDGKFRKVGEISGTNYTDARFQYDEDYLSDGNTRAISISLPKKEAPFSFKETEVFFDGLLPEAYTRRFLAERFHVDVNDYVSLLHLLGSECLGALRIADETDVYEEHYTKISEKEVRELASEGISKSMDMVTKSRLSLTGATGKTGLYFDEKTNTWFLPKGCAPSTHIVKQSHVRLDGIVTNEQLSLLTAAKCGIDVPASFIINVGNGNDSDILFATKRYDRTYNKNGIFVDGLPKPERLHQEDFAQAMGISSIHKYEANNECYLRKMFETIRNNSFNPLEDQLKLWDRIIFNCLIGNADFHIKNFSLIYSPEMKRISLAPAYDIVSTVIYDSSSKELPFRIGDAKLIDKITEKDFESACDEIGFNKKTAMKKFNSIHEKFEKALDEAGTELKESGFHKAVEIAERIKTYVN